MERKEIVTLDPRHLRISSYATGAGSPIMIEVIHIPTGHVVKREISVRSRGASFR